MVVGLVWKTGALLTATGMSFGAFGSHGLRARQPPLSEKLIANWGTASSYMIYNGLALLAISFHPGLNSGLKRYKAAPIMIASGAALFSGTIFGLVLLRDGGLRKVLGPLTPVGGMLMIGGYILLAL
ncbi:hypothetical protein DB88DRAFT_509400 [Papiliotrema laurentii]|uniref:DUF423-domain-containing protein n=1 Tax=Papiliotrema laurentii TaxID=5418 RepID=A0AAD9L6Z3_PAPLA|nr:hypothetical protein DB88DRAFT_509400 [Papiliotrema laurentii]